MFKAYRFNVVQPSGDAIVEAEQEVEPVKEVEPWESEPADCQQLLDEYVVENKFASSIPGAVLYLTKATNRAGQDVNIIEGQCHKLFLDTCRHTCDGFPAFG